MKSNRWVEGGIKEERKGGREGERQKGRTKRKENRKPYLLLTGN